jgi:hypothetical protein
MSGDGLVWLGLIALGAYHGVNPAMGWLFAVSRGLQERSTRAVLRSIGPIMLGHEAAVLVTAVMIYGLAATLSLTLLHVVAASVLVAFGVFRFVKPRAHFRWTRMRVGELELGVWSFLMATAHGAGLIVAPLLIGLQHGGAGVASDDQSHVDVFSRGSIELSALAITLHVLVMATVMTGVAVLVYRRLGLNVLRGAWINTDRAWALAFLVAGAVALVS